MSLIDVPRDSGSPLDVVERLAAFNDWSFDRAGDDEITILITGRWADYQVSFTWMDDIEALHLACAFDLKVPEPRRSEVLALIAEGRSNSAIAQRLFVTEKAVSKHSTSIFAKLDLAPSDDDNRRVLAVLAYLNT